jgi:hypothetical protein
MPKENATQEKWESSNIYEISFKQVPFIFIAKDDGHIRLVHKHELTLFKIIRTRPRYQETSPAALGSANRWTANMMSWLFGDWSWEIERK